MVEIAENRSARFEECEAALNYQFQDRGLLELALTHASVAPTRLASNERLEFLGDAVLGLVVSEALFHKYPRSAEGELTRLKSDLVSRHTCAAMTRELEVAQFMFLGKGLGDPTTVPSSVLGALFEALVAGIYLDGGLEAAREFILRMVGRELRRRSSPKQNRNYKSLLQHYAQRVMGVTPTYRLFDEQGPDHSKAFLVAAVIGETTYPHAWGSNKKEAEQEAARLALVDFGELEEEA